MKIINLLITLLIIVGCATSLAENTDESLGYEGYTKSSVDSDPVLNELEMLKKNPDAEFRTEAGWTIVKISQDHAFWSFPPVSHPAYPSFVKRRLQEKDGSIYMHTDVTCGATKEICDILVRDFIELNEKIEEGMKPE